MDIGTIVELIARLGVPSVVLGFAGWWMKWREEGFTRERDAMREMEQREEEQLIEIVKATSAALLEVKTALAEQTAAMRMLIERVK